MLKLCVVAEVDLRGERDCDWPSVHLRATGRFCRECRVRILSTVAFCGLRFELHALERFVADNPGVVPWLD